MKIYLGAPKTIRIKYRYNKWIAIIKYFDKHFFANITSKWKYTWK
jgi:hypothetical protein